MVMHLRLHIGHLIIAISNIDPNRKLKWYKLSLLDFTPQGTTTRYFRDRVRRRPVVTMLAQQALKLG